MALAPRSITLERSKIDGWICLLSQAAVSMTGPRPMSTSGLRRVSMTGPRVSMTSPRPISTGGLRCVSTSGPRPMSASSPLPPSR